MMNETEVTTNHSLIEWLKNVPRVTGRKILYSLLMDPYTRTRYLKKIRGAPSTQKMTCRDAASLGGDNALSLEYWDESTFLERRREWTELLKQSNCDHLFMSWEWHSAWWMEHKTDQSDLCIIAIYEAGVLLALAPMYLDKGTYVKGLVPVRRLQFIGKRFRGFSGIRTEYMNFIIRKDRLNFELPPLLLEALCKDRRWDELVLEDMATDELTYNVISMPIRLTQVGDLR
jgi:hypothetical protein